jgi:hypothetical protein
MEKVLVRFPNESYPIEMEIDWNEFKIQNEFKDEYFGWYKGTYIAVLK